MYQHNAAVCMYVSMCIPTVIGISWRTDRLDMDLSAGLL